MRQHRNIPALVRAALEAAQEPMTVVELCLHIGLNPFDRDDKRRVAGACEFDRSHGFLVNGPKREVLDPDGTKREKVTWMMPREDSCSVVIKRPAPDADPEIRKIVSKQPAFVAAWRML